MNNPPPPQSNIVTKEISKGVFLYKKQMPAQSHVDGTEMIYQFKVEVKAIQIIDFTADFTGSENIIVDPISNHHIQYGLNAAVPKEVGKNPLVITTTIHPMSAEYVATVKLQKNWKLKTKFRFTMRNPPIEEQRKYLT